MDATASQIDHVATYFGAAIEKLRWVMETQAEPIHAAAQAVANALEHGGLWYIFGTGHSHMLAEEAFYRAGGLLAVAPILEGSLMLHESAMQSSEFERVAGLAEHIVNARQVGPRDALLIASNSGRNAVPVELALEAKAQGASTIAITSMEHTQRVASRAPSGKRLYEVVDCVIDNAAPYGDAMVQVSAGMPPMGPVSTVTGAAIINAIAVQAATLLTAAQKPVHVWTSANVDVTGNPNAAYEKALTDVRQRVRHL